MPRKIFLLTGSGKWKELRFSGKGKTVTLPMTLVTYENIIIKYEV